MIAGASSKDEGGGEGGSVLTAASIATMVGGTLVGALIIGVLRNGLNLLDVSTYWQAVVIGGVIVVAVWIDVLRQRAAVRDHGERRPRASDARLADRHRVRGEVGPLGLPPGAISERSVDHLRQPLVV